MVFTTTIITISIIIKCTQLTAGTLYTNLSHSNIWVVSFQAYDEGTLTKLEITEAQLKFSIYVEWLSI